MAEGLAPSIAGNTAARSNYSPRVRGDSGIAAHSGWLQSCILATMPCSLFLQRLPQREGDAVPAVSRVRRPGAVPGPSWPEHLTAASEGLGWHAAEPAG